MYTSDSPRNTIARKPSHFGSYKNGPAGSSSASFASIGSIGGATAKPDDDGGIGSIICRNGRACDKADRPSDSYVVSFLNLHLIDCTYELFRHYYAVPSAR